MFAILISAAAAGLYIYIVQIIKVQICTLVQMICTVVQMICTSTFVLVRLYYESMVQIICTFSGVEIQPIERYPYNVRILGG